MCIGSLERGIIALAGKFSVTHDEQAVHGHTLCVKVIHHIH